jgi:predicted DNA-binding protein with PD1-like motif
VTSTLLHDGAQKTWVLVFDKGDEVTAAFKAFAREHRIGAAHFTAIGAFSRATLGYFDRQRREYDRIPIDEQVEVLALTGDVTLADDGVQLHAHAVVGKRDGSAHGGHVLEAYVWPTLELVLTESPAHLRRTSDPASGLALIDLSRTSSRAA